MPNINEDVLKNPFNGELGFIAKRFGILLRGTVDTVNRYGLKARHLHKYKSQVKSFFEEICALNCRSQVAEALRWVDRQTPTHSKTRELREGKIPNEPTSSRDTRVY
jgi:hypothetical protein